MEGGEAKHITINRKTTMKELTPNNSNESDSTDSESSDSDNSNVYSPDTDDGNQDREHEVQHRQYPLRNRRAHQIPNNIPWSVIHI